MLDVHFEKHHHIDIHKPRLLVIQHRYARKLFSF